MTGAIELRDVFRLYPSEEGGAVALQGLTLTVREREVVVVFGPSGSGKSTLLRILAGLDVPSAGTVRVLGHDLRRLRGRTLREYRSRLLGYVEQHYTRALAPELTARELVALQLALLGVPRRLRLRRADELLDRVGLGDRRDARPPELSGGQQQRVAVCAALAHRPRLLIADEPTGELDAASAAVTYDAIGRLGREAGATIVIVSHDPASAEIADRVLQVRDGRVAGETTREPGAREQIVVARGGWVRLPEEFLRRSGIDARADAALAGDRIVIRALGGGTPASAAGAGVAAAAAPAAAAPVVVVEARGLSKSFAHGGETRHVLRGLDAAFSLGRVTAVTGASGSGKTTFLHLLAGVERPTAGDVLLLGEPFSALDDAGRARLRRARIAVVSQVVELAPFLSARENVELGLALRTVAAGETAERAQASLAAVGLAELADQRVARLSTGERQRVALARALATRPALLLADEPTARLDETNARAVAGLLVRLAREHDAAVVCATHDPVLIEQADEELPLEVSAPARGTRAARHV